MAGMFSDSWRARVCVCFSSTSDRAKVYKKEVMKTLNPGSVWGYIEVADIERARARDLERSADVLRA